MLDPAIPCPRARLGLASAATPRSQFARKPFTKTIELNRTRIEASAIQVEITWCVSGSDCNPGYSNLATIPAGSTRGITLTGPEPQGLTGHVEFAACRNGFTPNQGPLSRQSLHA